MTFLQSSAQAYTRLGEITDDYDKNQARLQELRALSRALRVLAATYATVDRMNEPMAMAMCAMTEQVGVERNRLYVENSRQADEMTRLNSLIQNGVFNE
jgi:hypothetical protein